MTTICVLISHPDSTLVHNRLDNITARIPCFARYDSKSGEATIGCRVEDAAFVERMLADLV